MTDFAFTADEITELLAELDDRLRRAGVSAAAFIVGGAAVAVRSSGDRRTNAPAAIRLLAEGAARVLSRHR